MSFKIYADFETLLKRVQNNDRSNTSYTEKCQKHIPCSFAYKVVCVDHEFTKSVVLYRGKRPINRFIEKLLESMINAQKINNNNNNDNNNNNNNNNKAF